MILVTKNCTHLQSLYFHHKYLQTINIKRSLSILTYHREAEETKCRQKPGPQQMVVHHACMPKKIFIDKDPIHSRIRMVIRIQRRIRRVIENTFHIFWPQEHHFQCTKYFVNILCSNVILIHYFSPINTFLRKWKDLNPNFIRIQIILNQWQKGTHSSHISKTQQNYLETTLLV